MEEQLLPIVQFGKYKDKNVLELLADVNYVEWLKQQSWFPTQKQIYNIVVNQTISTTNNSKTPEHNKLQNLFLDKSNQEKLLSKLYDEYLICINNLLFKDINIIKCFGEKTLQNFIFNLDKTTINFEDRFNWDVVIYNNYYAGKKISILSNLETELFDKIKYKEQYDIEENEKYNNNLLLIDRLIESRIKLDQENKNKYDKAFTEYLDNYKKYENELTIYLQQKLQNDKDVENYEKKLNEYETKLDNFKKNQTQLICKELVIDYHDFIDWKSRNRSRNNKYTYEEERKLEVIVNDKLELFTKKFEEMNTRPNKVYKLDIPSAPRKPLECNFKGSIDIDIWEEIKNLKGFENRFNTWDDLNELNNKKKEYQDEYIKNYDKNFNNYYKKYRLLYYQDIINKINKYNRNFGEIDVFEINENQYKISINFYDYNYAVCCELKPTLSDDYPNVLRKLKAQIELTQNDKTIFKEKKKHYILIIGSFTSVCVSKEQLITIFKQSNIKVIFTDEIFETSNLVTTKYANTNIATEQVLLENKLIEENKFLRDNLLQTQDKLLQAEEKIKQLEEKCKKCKNKL